jgi:hypothetical protein
LSFHGRKSLVFGQKVKEAFGLREHFSLSATFEFFVFVGTGTCAARGRVHCRA